MTFFVSYLFFIILISSGIIAWVYHASRMGDFSLGFFCSLLASFLFGILTEIDKFKRNALTFRLAMTSIFHPHQQIRVSVAYLFRLQIDSKFLLIRNEIRGNLAPIGGVYKYYKEFAPIINDIGAIQNLGTDHYRPEKNKHELRLQFEIRHLGKFIEWFNSGLGREYDPHREFSEELIDTKFLPKSMSLGNMKYFKYASYGRFDGYKKKYKYYEYHFFDIFEICLTNEQEKIICQKINQYSQSAPLHQELFLASRQEIELSRMSVGLEIGDHAIYLL